jgi:hypothetical protein
MIDRLTRNNTDSPLSTKTKLISERATGNDIIKASDSPYNSRYNDPYGSFRKNRIRKEIKDGE